MPTAAAVLVCVKGQLFHSHLGPQEEYLNTFHTRRLIGSDPSGSGLELEENARDAVPEAFYAFVGFELRNIFASSLKLNMISSLDSKSKTKQPTRGMRAYTTCYCI